MPDAPMPRKAPPSPAPFEPPDDEPTEVGRVFDKLEDGLAFDERTQPGFVLEQDRFETSSVAGDGLDPHAQVTGVHPTLAAPEISQGPWKERAFVPRPVMLPAQVVTGMAQAFARATQDPSAPPERVRAGLETELLPLLRQAVEQAGGDGLDAWLHALENPNAPAGKDPLLGQLGEQMSRLDRALDTGALVAEGERLCALVKGALEAQAPSKISLRRAEKDLEGRLELDVLLSIFFGGQQALAERGRQVEQALDGLKSQMRTSPGVSPQSLMSNYARLKTEKKVVEAELRRRAARSG
jgi:hypothetical protein